MKVSDKSESIGGGRFLKSGANVIMRSRVRERRTHGSVRGLRHEPLVYSTAGEL